MCVTSTMAIKMIFIKRWPHFMIWWHFIILCSQSPSFYVARDNDFSFFFVWIDWMKLSTNNCFCCCFRPSWPIFTVIKMTNNNRFCDPSWHCQIGTHEKKKYISSLHTRYKPSIIWAHMQIERFISQDLLFFV